MDDFQHRRNTVGCEKMNNETDEVSVKKEENWKDICKNCEVLRLDLGCGFGCEIIASKLKKRI